MVAHLCLLSRTGEFQEVTTYETQDLNINSN